MFFRILLMSLLCFAGASLAHPILSKDKTAKIIQKSEFVFEIQKRFPLVLTSDNAKSKDGMCSIMIDLINGLVSTGLCEVNKVEAYTRNVMWIGSLTYIGNGLSNITSFDSRTNYNHTWFGGVGVANPYDIWVVEVEFDEPTEIADSSNISAVSCPSGKKPVIVSDELDPSLFYWDCYTPWKCKKGEYSIDEHTCGTLPENARRNTKEGFLCNKGFVPVKETCEEKRTCNENEHYDELSNACWTLPQNAKWADSVFTKNDFVCDVGFVKNNQYSTCDAKIECNPEQHYDEKTNQCWELPQNAYWKNNVSKSDDWSCLDGYVKIEGTVGEICVKKKKCKIKDYYNQGTNSCWTLPKNARWNSEFTLSEDDWSCISGYERMENSCQKRVVCDDDEIQLENGKCEVIPLNSHKVDSKTWQCNAGYDKVLDNNKSYCEERKTKGSSIPTEWIATGASILLGLICLLISMN